MLRIAEGPVGRIEDSNKSNLSPELQSSSGEKEKKKLSNRTNPVLVFLNLRGFQVFENFLLKHRKCLGK